RGANLPALTVHAGDAIQVGYAVSLPGHHDAATMTFSRAQVVIDAACDGDSDHDGDGHHGDGHQGTRGPFLIDIPDATVSVPANSAAWLPTADPRSAAGYQGSFTMPDLCKRGPIHVRGNATFTAMIGSH
ncbi:MAG TPA: hypothetical protein VLW85_17950, partial [Myxococcales bacterium]|nr:hypothetical protein [Myxococcales bacterium]